MRLCARRSIVPSTLALLALRVPLAGCQPPTSATHATVADVRPLVDDVARLNVDAGVAVDPSLAATARARDSIPGVRCSVSRQGALYPPSEFAAEDVNADGQLDLVERVSTLYAESDGSFFILPNSARITLPWARIGRGERCVLDDSSALDYARRRCPSRPTRLIDPRLRSIDEARSAALEAVACARAWGVSAEEIRRSLARELPSGRSPAVSTRALGRFAELLNPPWTLQARPSRAR